MECHLLYLAEPKTPVGEKVGKVCGMGFNSGPRYQSITIPFSAHHYWALNSAEIFQLNHPLGWIEKNLLLFVCSAKNRKTVFQDHELVIYKNVVISGYMYVAKIKFSWLKTKVLEIHLLFKRLISYCDTFTIRSVIYLKHCILILWINIYFYVASENQFPITNAQVWHQN